MNHHPGMPHRLWPALLAAVLGQPVLASDAADEPNLEQEYELGAYLLGGDSWRFGKYTGLTDDGSELLLDFRIERKPKWDSGDTVSWRLQGWRLGLDSRRLAFDYRDQGTWGLAADYRELPNYRFNDGATPFLGAGTGELQLPPGWVAPAGGSTATFATLGDSLAPYASQWTRKRLDLNYDRNIDRNWTFRIDWRHETRKGDGVYGGVIGNTGLNARTALLPAPIDWETDIMEASFDYSNARYQLGAGVYASWFTNNEPSLTWQNPYGARGSWEQAAGFPGGQGRSALAPDNQALRFKVYGGFNLSDTSRLAADLMLGSMEQDEALLGYTVNPGLAVSAPLPRASADAEVRTTHANVRYTARPLNRLGILANFTLDERDNRTPQATWVYVGGDSENQKPAMEGRINLPYGYRRKQWDLTATWRATGGARLEAGAEWTDYHRRYSEVLGSDETRLFAGLSFRRWARATLSVDYAWINREVDDYLGARPYQASRVAGSVGADEFGNLPALRKYNLTDRQRDELRFRADFFPTERFNFALAASRFEDDYNDGGGLFGLQAARVSSWSLDAGFYPTESLSLTGYYTREDYASHQTGRMWTNGITARNPANDWRADFDDEAETWNLAVELSGLGQQNGLADRLRLGLDFTYSSVDSDIRVTGADNIAALPLPRLTDEMSAWSLFARYAFNERLGLRFAYQEQELTSTDFALDDVPVDGSPSALLMGQAAPNYDVSLITLSLSYRY